jgi:hypothetical protein
MDRIVRQFVENTETVWKIYEHSSVNTPYTLAHYKLAINELELEGQAAIDKPRVKRMRAGKLTLGESRLVSISRKVI